MKIFRTCESIMHIVNIKSFFANMGTQISDERFFQNLAWPNNGYWELRITNCLFLFLGLEFLLEVVSICFLAWRPFGLRWLDSVALLRGLPLPQLPPMSVGGFEGFHGPSGPPTDLARTCAWERSELCAICLSSGLQMLLWASGLGATRNRSKESVT